jgi:hypothetical protein
MSKDANQMTTQTSKLSGADLSAMLKVGSVASSQGDVVEQILQEIIGNKHIRYRSGPEQDQREAMKAIVSHWVNNDYQPIPFLCPCGSEKPRSGEMPDVSELAMIESIRNLRQRVQRWYPPGIIVHMRIEDASAPYLFKGREEEAWANADAYSASLVKLIEASRSSWFIKAKRESEHIEWAAFSLVAKTHEENMLGLIKKPHDLAAQARAHSMGWMGLLSDEMLEYYRGCYLRLYGHLSAQEVDETLARYFASSLSRYKLHITGTDSAWGRNFLGINFCAPVPGAPKMRNIVYYRTIPASVSSMHGAPWRMKGYIQRGTNTPRLTSWNDPQQFTPGVIDVNGYQLTADYGN